MSSSEQKDNAPAEEDLYLRLKLTKDATPADLKRSFRKLSQLYHPDKHIDDDAKATATDQFTRVKEAYEILSDTKLRRVYDEFGLDAARLAGTQEMEMVPYSDLAERFRNDANNTGPSAGVNTPRDAYFTVINAFEPRIDATGLVVALEEGESLAQNGLAICSQVAMSFMATAYVTQRHTLAARYSLRGEGTLNGSRRSAGVGEIALSARTQLDSYTHAEATAYVPLDESRATHYGLKLFRSLSEDMTGSVEATIDPLRGAVTTALTYTRSFDERCTASTFWAYGATSGYAFTWKRNAYDEYISEAKPRERKDGDEFGADRESFRQSTSRLDWIVERLKCLIEPMGWRWTARLNVMDISVGFVLRRPIGENAPFWRRCDPRGPGGASVKVRGNFGMMGWEVEVGGGWKYVLADTAWGTSVSFGSAGVTWRLKITRAGHRFTLPVVLVSSTCDARVATLAAISTSLVLSAAQILVIEPWGRSKRQQEREEAKLRRADLLAQLKSEAEAAAALMTQAVERCRQREREVEIDGESGRGLLIERAIYGVNQTVRQLKLSDANVVGREIALEATDVTESVQLLVENSAVQVVSGTKSTLTGFWDPSAFGDKEELVLRIWYRFKGEIHDCVIRDDEPIELPLSSHRVGFWS